MIKPMSGVKRTDKKKDHPKPILLLAPNNPTNAAKKESVNNPNINSVNPIVLKCFACVGGVDGVHVNLSINSAY